MDESMRIIIAYAELVVGFPLLLAKIVWFVPSAILTGVLAKVACRMDQIVDAAIEGFIAILVACLVFDRLHLHAAWAVPLIMIVVQALWDWTKEEHFRALSSALGIVSGFLLYPAVLEYLVDRCGLSQIISS